MMHEGDSVCAPGITHRYFITRVFEPFNLVSLNAAHASISHAVCAACTKEPQTRIRFCSIRGALNWHFEGELMVHFFAVVFVIVWYRGRKLHFTFELEHLDGANISLKVMEARNYSPRHSLRS